MENLSDLNKEKLNENLNPQSQGFLPNSKHVSARELMAHDVCNFSPKLELFHNH